MRLSDLAETRATLRMSGPTGRTASAMDGYLKVRRVNDGCMAIVGGTGTSAGQVRARRSMAFDILRRHGAATLGGAPGSRGCAIGSRGPTCATP